MTPSAERTFIEAARRAQIIDAAIATIAEVGYASTSLARIAARAGISTALVSYHFDGRDDLMLAVMATLNDRTDRAVTADTDRAPTYVAALRELITSMIRYFGAHRTEVLAFGQLYSGAAPGSAVAERAAEDHRRGLNELAQMFREGQAEWEYRSFDVEVMATALMATLQSVPGELLADPSRTEAYAVEVAELFVRAVAAG
jgi:TetR/AcrR family fatty acid metabolism transcriptional regulator